MLIDTREPPDEPRQAIPRRGWRLRAPPPLILLATGLGLALLSGAFSPVPAYLLIVTACVFIGRGLATIVRNTPGLKDYRQ